MTQGKAGDRPASTTFHVVTHVWGREYLDMFLDLCVPNQLAAGNLPSLPSGSRYRLLTRAEHIDELNAHPAVGAPREVMPVDVLAVDALDHDRDLGREYDLMNACHRRAIDDAYAAGAALILLSADVVMSANTLAAVARRHREGYRAVVVAGLRLNKESFLDELGAAGAPGLDTLSPRELVRLALPHLHAYTKSMYVGARRFCKMPTGVYWPVGDDGIVARCLCVHPLMIDPMRAVQLVEGTADGPYIAQACPDFSRIHVVTDSDELQLFELTVSRRLIARTSTAGTPEWRAAIMASSCDALQNYCWQRHPVHIHAGDIDARWDPVAKASASFARRVTWRKPYARVARKWIGRRQEVAPAATAGMAGRTSRPPSTVFDAITPVWTREGLETFLSACLPTFVAAGNLPSLPEGSRYRLLTRSAYVAQLNALPAIEMLRRVLPVEVVAIEALDREKNTAGAEDLLQVCYQKAIADAVAVDAAILFLPADTVLSRGALEAVVQRHREGKRAVVASVLVLSRERAAPPLASAAARVGALSPRELVRESLPHLHPYTQSMLSDTRRFVAAPPGVYWPVGNDGVLGRCFRLHPLMIDPMAVKPLKGPLDGHYLSRVCPDVSPIHVVTDSDELQMCELASRQKRAELTDTAGASVLRCAITAGKCDPLQLHYWTRDIRIHGSEIDAAWEHASSVAQRFADQALARRWNAELMLTCARQVDRIRRAGGRPIKLLARGSEKVLRPVRLATHRSAKRLRKSVRQVFRQVGISAR